MFTKISWNNASAVFTGDASLFKESKMLLLKDVQWQANLLKAGHHGSYLSTGKQWLNAIQPQQVIISCGKNNPYRHPHKPTLKRIKESGIPILRTDQLGDIIFVPTSCGFQRKNKV